MKKRMSKKELAKVLYTKALNNSNRLYHGLAKKSNKIHQRNMNVLVDLIMNKLTKTEIKYLLSKNDSRLYEGRIYGRDQIRIFFDEGYFVLVVAQPHQSIDEAIDSLLKK